MLDSCIPGEVAVTQQDSVSFSCLILLFFFSPSQHSVHQPNHDARTFHEHLFVTTVALQPFDVDGDGLLCFSRCLKRTPLWLKNNVTIRHGQLHARTLERLNLSLSSYFLDVLANFRCVCSNTRIDFSSRPEAV